MSHDKRDLVFVVILGIVLHHTCRLFADDSSLASTGDRESILSNIEKDIAKSTAIIDRDPDAVAEYFRRAIRLDEKMELLKSIKDYGQVLRLSSDPDFYLFRGDLWQEIGEPELAESDFNEALRLIEAALQKDPRLETFNLRNRARAWYTKGQIEKAISDLDKAVAREAENLPFCSVLLEMRGIARRRLGDLDKAEADFAHALEIDPENAGAFFERGRLRNMRGDFANAITDFDESIRLKPEHPILYASRAYANLNLHEYEKAIADCSQAIKIFPLYAPAYRHRGCARLALGQIDLALDDLNQAVRFTPNYVKPTSSGRELYPARRARDRVYYYDFLPQLDRAGVWRLKGEWEKAIADLKETLRMDPASTQAQNDLAWIQATCPDAKFRDGKSAIELARKACEATKWKKDDFIVTLAAAHAEIGEYDEAVRRVTQANEIDPKRDAATREQLLKLFKQSMPYRDSVKEK